MNAFDHDSLDVDKAAIDFVTLADAIVEHLPRARGYLADRLQRAATSAALNVSGTGTGTNTGTGTGKKPGDLRDLKDAP